MKERPIIFSAPMVRAILDGRKTQTRRIVKLREFQPCSASGDGWDWDFRDRAGRWNSYTTKQLVESGHNPYGTVGDCLWVRESWSHDGPDLNSVRAAHEDASPDLGYGPYYRATEVAPDTLRWISPLFMPRWASRITLEVIEVRVQRLHEITEDDAREEGVEPIMWERLVYPSGRAATVETPSYRDGFGVLWDEINSKRGPWSSNPWIWALTFRRLP